MARVSVSAKRIVAMSDVHADLAENRAWLSTLSSRAYADAALILAGDVTDDLVVLGRTLRALQDTFAAVFFVPGNHELWVRRGECADSMEKFERVATLCEGLGVLTRPARIEAGAGGAAWVVPLVSWYTGPEEGDDSLFVPKPGEDPTLSMWSDRYFTAWPSRPGAATVAARFLAMNEAHVARAYDAPVISFSHFLPRRELIFATPEERAAVAPGLRVDPHPRFNFSRVAGCRGLDEQIHRLGARAHVYGHQHRNRDRTLDGVRYLSQCLGYPRERTNGMPGRIAAPMVVWEASPA
jgi:predicted phosphodiesterase